MCHCHCLELQSQHIKPVVISPHGTGPTESSTGLNYCHKDSNEWNMKQVSDRQCNRLCRVEFYDEYGDVRSHLLAVEGV